MENNKSLTNAFLWLFIGLLVCFGVSLGAMQYVDKLYAPGTGLIFIILELGIAIVLSLFIRKLPPIVAKILYIIYTAITGLSLTGIFYIYTSASITYVFLATSLIFGAFAVIGKTTKMDLSKWWIYLLIALFGIIVMEIINIFLANHTINMLIAILSILVFAGYTAYDVNRLVHLSNEYDHENMGIFFAFQLFLDFINLFIKLLQLFGKSRD